MPNNPDRIDGSNYDARRMQAARESIQRRAAEAGKQQRAAEKKKQEQSKKKDKNDPILTVIGREAALGRLIYDFPADPILRTIRGLESSVLNPIVDRDPSSQWREQEQQDQQVQRSEETETTIHHKKLHYFAEQHRQGHLDGLLQVMQEGDSRALLEIILNNLDSTPTEVTQKVAALLEAAKDDSEVFTELVHALDTSEAWSVIKISHEMAKEENNSIKVANVPESAQFLFPNCQLTTLRQVDLEEVPAAFRLLANRWKAVIARSTSERARRYIQAEQDIENPEELASEIVEAMTEEIR